MSASIVTRNHDTLALVVAYVSLISAGSAFAEERWKPIPPGITIETGDTWIADGQRHRLYGVQSCLRGTSFTTLNGLRQDCGEASLAMLAALIRDLKPVCAVVAQAANGSVKHTVCTASLQQDGRIERLDLGTALIASGFAFASLGPGGGPLHPGYGAAEQEAERARAGLWATGAFQHPVKALRGSP
jgi:endonuclease YncB( thermonuclease family)